MRVIFWLLFHALTLWTLDIEITYTDGLHVKLNGWPNALMRLWKARTRHGADDPIDL